MGYETFTVEVPVAGIEEQPPIPDAYRLEALELICSIQSYDELKFNYLRGTIDRTARWLMDRDARTTQR